MLWQQPAARPGREDDGCCDAVAHRVERGFKGRAVRTHAFAASRQSASTLHSRCREQLGSGPFSPCWQHRFHEADCFDAVLRSSFRPTTAPTSCAQRSAACQLTLERPHGGASSSTTTRPTTRARSSKPRQLTFPVELDYLFEHEQGRSAALNAGIRRVVARVIVTTDDDVRVEPDWLDARATALDDAASATTSAARCCPIWGAPRPAWMPDHGGKQWAVIALLDYGAGADPVFHTRASRTARRQHGVSSRSVRARWAVGQQRRPQEGHAARAGSARVDGSAPSRGPARDPTRRRWSSSTSFRRERLNKR